MSFSEQNIILQDASNQVSRSDLLRQLSIHSSSTSTSSKRGSTRITKQTSASNSPHYVQRRRTTANHNTRAYPRLPLDGQYRTREQRLQNYSNARDPSAFARPMSWHPGSSTADMANTQGFGGEPALWGTTARLEDLTIGSQPAASSVQESIHHAFAMGYGYPMGAPAATHDMPSAIMPEYSALSADNEPSYNSYPTYSISDQPQYPYIPQATMYHPYTGQNHQFPQQWSHIGSDYTIAPQAPQAVPDYPPVDSSTQLPPSRTQRLDIPTNASLHNKNSKELIGMGLYDDKVSDFMSGLNSAISANPNRESSGKGLKLEETWQPPNEEEDEDDEAYSTDEAEEVEEVPLPSMPSMPAKDQKPFYPNYDDLSNQSFFFNDDDEYNNDDQYARYLTFGQDLQGGQSRPIPEPDMQNYMWL